MPNHPVVMLTFTEEILLLLLGEEDGAFLPVNSNAFECALAGATLMDLAFALRIDTDLESLIVLTENPTGISMLDSILAKIVTHPEVMDAQSWVRLLAREEANTIREQALASLVDRGILEQRETRRVGHYPMRDGTAQREVKLHLRDVLLADDIPDPRDVVRVSLADACGIFPEILSEREIKQATPRIRQLRIMDLIGREVAGAIAAIQRTMLMAVRARLARFRKYLLALAAIGGLAALGTVLIPRIPIPDRFGPTLLERLWGDGAWQEWSGYVLLALSIAGFSAASLRRVRFVCTAGRSELVAARACRARHVVRSAPVRPYRLSPRLQSQRGIHGVLYRRADIRGVCRGSDGWCDATPKTRVRPGRQAVPPSDADAHHRARRAAGAVDRPPAHRLPLLREPAHVR